MTKNRDTEQSKPELSERSFPEQTEQSVSGDFFNKELDPFPS